MNQPKEPKPPVDPVPVQERTKPLRSRQAILIEKK